MRRQWIWIILASALMAVGAIGYWLSAPLRGAQPYEGTELSGAAPDFKLTDQHGSSVALSDSRGKLVVLTFFDSRCTDVCPLTAAQLLQAYQKLNRSEVDQIVFLGVNVNVRFNSVSDAMDTTQRWHLDQIPNWHFLTGNAEELMPVWSAFGVSVNPQSSGEIMHTPGVFLIDQNGQERWYISTPYDQYGASQGTAPLGDLIVEHLRELLKEK